MMQIFSVTFRAIMVILAADFFTGFIHWLEDSFWTEETPFLGKWLIQPNELHHRKPTAFLTGNWWQSSYDAILVGVVILIVAWLLHHLNWEMWLFVLVSMNATQIHKYSHQSQSKLPRAIRWLQRMRIIQNSRHHVKHHQGIHNSHYCLITPIMNPILDITRFWKFAEYILKPLLGKTRV
jgi:ubiquitin-conjugating enzyme E2 variant